MLEPDSRSLLSDLLRPPPGFALSHAVGTTFTLTLDAALAVPLSLVGSRAGADDAAGIVSAARRAVDKIDVFAQSGYVKLGAASDLVTVLEPMIHPVVMAPGRLFHPKVWFLEFAAGDERRYRFICSSRNLTNDRTWDAVVALDGDPLDAPGDDTIQMNAGMVRLLRWLADGERTVPQLHPDRRARIERLSASWRAIRWEHPEHVRRLAVHAFGVGADSSPSMEGTNALIVAPFVTDNGLARLRARRGYGTTLISRPEQLDRLSPASFDRLSMRVLDDFVDQALTDADAQSSGRNHLSGLHAKIVVRDRAHKQSSVLIGSANATSPAWSANVEVMVELHGSKNQLGVDAVSHALAPLLEEYSTEGGAAASDDEQAERSLANALRTIAATRLTLRVLSDDAYTVMISARLPVPALPDGLRLSWRLLTQTDAVTGSFPPEAAPHQLRNLSLAEITPFIVATLTDSTGRQAQSILVAEIIDDISGRHDAIAASHLTEPGAFARFIRLMLQQHHAGIGSIDSAASSFRMAFGSSVSGDGSGLLELLVRAAATSQDALADVARVVSHLSGEERMTALPPGFTDVWEAVIDSLGSEVPDER